MPNTYSFSGDFTTLIGFLGVVSTAIIVVTAFRRFFNSPYNFRVEAKTTTENVDHE